MVSQDRGNLPVAIGTGVGTLLLPTPNHKCHGAMIGQEVCKGPRERTAIG